MRTVAMPSAARAISTLSHVDYHFVLGLEIQSRTPDCVLLAVSSRFRMRGELLFERQPQTLFYATFVQQDNRVARAVWAAGAPVHRWAVRYLMEQVSRRTDAGPKHKT